VIIGNKKVAKQLGSAGFQKGNAATYSTESAGYCRCE
jgi:hypothetical protein